MLSGILMVKTMEVLMYTIGYDFNDTIIQLKNLQFSVRLFTEQNVYAPDPDQVIIKENEHSVSLATTGLSWAGNQRKAEGNINLKVTFEDDRFVVSGSGKHKNEVCKSILVQVYGINITNINFDQNLDQGLGQYREISSQQYPKDIKMPLIFVEDRNEATWFALSKDDQLQAKAFASHYNPYLETQVLDLSHESDKRFRTNEIQMPEWHIGSCVDKNTIIQERCQDLEINFNLVPFQERQDTPYWLKDIKLVTILHGEHWTGHVFNTFSEMEDVLKWLVKKIDGKHVLAFLPGWDGRYYYNYPEYEPSIAMGGKEGFKCLVNTAHQLGIKLVPMLGANNANIEVMKNLGLEDAALQDAWGHEKRVDWVDWDYDLFKENNCYLANMGHPEYLKHMIERSKNLVDSYGVDGIFLDITIWWENDPHYSPYEGLLKWAKTLKADYPELLLFGENSYDALWGVFSVFHEQGYPGGHGNALYKYAMQTHYLAYPAPGMGSGGIHEFAWNENGQPWERDIPELIPTLSIVGDTLNNYKKSTEYTIQKAKNWEPLY